MEEFEKYLKKCRKKRTGDNLIQSTIDVYLRLTKQIFKKNIIGYKKDDLIEYLRIDAERNKDPIRVAAYKHLLIFLGHKDSVDRIKITESNHRSALNSKRMMQSMVISKRDIKLLIDKADKNEFGKLLFSMLYDTACRKDEILTINIRNINFKKREINVMGKGKKTRQVYYNNTTESLLMEHIGNNDLQSDDLLFVFKFGKNKPHKDQAKAMWDYVRLQGEKHLGRHIHPHMFRHSALTHMSDEGADILDIKAYAGHEDIATSQIYTEISSFRRSQAFKKFKPDIMEGDA